MNLQNGFSLTGEAAGYEVRGATIPPAARREMIVVGDCSVEAVVGYRSWLVRMDSGHSTLCGRSMQQEEWPRGRPIEAVHSVTHRTSSLFGRPIAQNTHEAPWNQCTCGVHAYNDPAHLGFYPERTVLGEVHLWGRIAVHSHGYRAQFARPAAFYLPPKGCQADSELVRLCAMQHDVPLVQVPDDIRSEIESGRGRLDILRIQSAGTGGWLAKAYADADAKITAELERQFQVLMYGEDHIRAQYHKKEADDWITAMRYAMSPVVWPQSYHGGDT